MPSTQTSSMEQARDQLLASTGYRRVEQWMSREGKHPFAFQVDTWTHMSMGRSGLVNAPTGCGKTFSVFLGAVIDFMNQHPGDFSKKTKNHLQLIWITPLRALAKDLARAMESALKELQVPWKVGIRNGDTDAAERQRQKRQMPEILLITPESLHLLLAQRQYPEIFRSLRWVAVDEWHELLGSKRGVQVELAIARFVHLRQEPLLENPTPKLQVWGISATIGNLSQAMEVLMSSMQAWGQAHPVLVKADMDKQIEVESIIPEEMEKYPWAGHLGLKLIHRVVPILEESRTTLLFINTRGMSERWYQELLNVSPDLAGALALHHGSVDMELRLWVEEALHEGILKAVVCTASLDLGVDFRPVDTVIQVGSPKGVARFLQRAGRSGHQPDAVSKIFFLPTHALELVEAAALKSSLRARFIESRQPRILCFDVLIQYLCTLAISEGFDPATLFEEIRSTYCYRELEVGEWQEILQFIRNGGAALTQYDEFRKVEVIDGLFRIRDRRIAMRHRMHIGTIVSDSMIKVKFMSGGYVGVIEEYFISRLNPGDVFTLAGRNLEFVMIKDSTALVRKSNSKKSIVPSWQGGRMPLSANLGKMLRRKLSEVPAQWDEAKEGKVDLELRALEPVFRLQQELSHVPRENELLMEHIETKDGYHLFVYPFEGRLVHEAMASLLAYRISRIAPITFSFAMNDYGFELLSDVPIPVDDTNVYDLFSPEKVSEDIQRSINSAEMARRKFREIAVIGGLIFQGYPGQYQKPSHLQSSASLLFNVFSEYDPHNLLLRQAYHEVMEQEMEEARLRDMLHRIQASRIVLKFPGQLTPFCFPIKVDSLRGTLSSESLEDRIKKMQQA